MRLMVLFNGHTDKQGRQDGKYISLQKNNQHLDNINE